MMDQYVWISVLDSKTSAICQDRDGDVYTFGEGPLPPAHFGCRSTIVGYDGTTQDIPSSLANWIEAQPDAEALTNPAPVSLDDIQQITSAVTVSDGSVSFDDQTDEFLKQLRALIGDFVDVTTTADADGLVPTLPELETMSKPAPGDRVVTVNVAKVDALWAGTDLHVAPAEPGENFKLDRAKAFIANLKDGDTFKAPQLGVGKDHLGFDDGRHRFAAMRDLGYKEAPVSMDKQSIRNARARGLLA